MITKHPKLAQTVITAIAPSLTYSNSAQSQGRTLGYIDHPPGFPNGPLPRRGSPLLYQRAVGPEAITIAPVHIPKLSSILCINFNKILHLCSSILGAFPVDL